MKQVRTMGDFEFQVKVNGRNTLEYRHDGKTYIEGRKGSGYSLWFFNNTSKRVLAIFSVDGLSIMDGKPASKDADGYVVNPWNSVEIPGWRINQSKVAMFKFTPQGDRDQTYVEELASEGFNVDPSNQGVIGCMVYEEKEKPAPVVVDHHYHYHHPKDSWNNISGVIYCDASSTYTLNSAGSHDINGNVGQFLSFNGNVGQFLSSGDVGQNVGLRSVMSASSKGSDSLHLVGLTSGQIHTSAAVPEKSLGTAFGEDKKFETHEVDFEKKAYSSWTGLIYYDTLLNLKKKGVIIERKEPDAFPGSNGCYVPKRRQS